MFEFEKLTLPIGQPLLVFTIILLIVLLSPLIFKKSGIPDIIGLILAGVVVGPHGLNILSEDFGLNSIFGVVGLLYLMFLAGLEININEFKQNKTGGIAFGLFTFFIPFGLGMLFFHYMSNFGLEASLLLSIMFSAHTLISYPVLGKLGIVHHRIVAIIVAGTIIADTMVLIILGVMTEVIQSELSTFFWLKTIASFGIFFFYIIKILPWIAKWFFKNQTYESSLQYVFVLMAVFGSSSFAGFLNIEPIIGAFLSGLALNQQIVRTSPLMNRIIFIGNTLFIPFFLITIGMFVNVRLIASNPESLVMALTLIVLALSGKYLAALVTQKIFRFSGAERNLMFGLSSARAASAIAVVYIGFNFGIFEKTTVNDTVLLVLVTSLISSVVTQRAGSVIAERLNFYNVSSQKKERIMVSISNPSTIKTLVEFSILIKDQYSGEPIFPITIVRDNENAGQQVAENRQILEKAMIHASLTDNPAQLITRIDQNVADGLLRSIKEFGITKLIIGWHGKLRTEDFLFGTLLDKLLNKTEKMILVLRLSIPVGLIEKMHVVIPVNCDKEIGFSDLLQTIKNIKTQSHTPVQFYGDENTLVSIRQAVRKLKMGNDVVYKNQDVDSAFFSTISAKIRVNDLFVLIDSRKNRLSYHSVMTRYPKMVNKYFEESNILIIYPEQANPEISVFDYSEMELSGLS